VASSRLERKLVKGTLLLYALPAALWAAGLVVVVVSGALAGNRAGLIVLAVVGVIPLVLYLALAARWSGRKLVQNIHTIQLGTELMATANPDHRLAIDTGDEFQSLAEDINRMADRLRLARTGLEEEISRATRALTVERTKLSAVLESLGEGVIVITPEGRISLSNAAAQELLAFGGASLLGRSLFEVVDREKLTYFVDRLRASGGVEHFSLEPVSGAVLATVMTPYFDSAREMVGLILVFRDVTRAAQSDEQRLAVLASTVWDLRGPLASIRSLSENLLDSREVSGDVARRMLQAIHAEALRLSGLVAEMGDPRKLGLARAPEHFESITVSDLIAMAIRRLGPDGALVERDGRGRGESADVNSAALLRVKAEASALSGALAWLLRVVLDRARGQRVWLRPGQRGVLLELDIGGPGRAPVAELEECLDQPMNSGGRRLSVRDTCRRHAGEVWAYTEADRIGFRFTFPVAEESTEIPGAPATGRRFAGAGTQSAFGLQGVTDRPDFYDFSLFEEMRRSLAGADLEHPLDELTCVVFDTETTGLNPDQGDRIVSIAAVRVRNGVVKRGEVFDALVNPGRRIPEESGKYHGITEVMVAGAPSIDVVLPEFLRFVENSVLVAHQVWFDVRFLDPATRRLGLPPLTAGRPVLDTVLLSEVVHGPLRRHGIPAMAERFGIVIEGRHSALGDALVTAEIFVRLIGLLKKRGIATLGEVLEATRRARDPSRR
jgi:DNA polymerase III subunit epsilon